MMSCKLQVIGLLTIIAIVHAATILVTDIVYVTVLRSAIYNESGVFYTEYILGNHASTSISTTTDEVFSTLASIADVIKPTLTPLHQPESTSVAAKAVTTKTRTSITAPPPPSAIEAPASSITTSTTKVKVQYSTKPTIVASSPVLSSLSTNSDPFTNEILSAHNVKRAAHDVAPLSWSQELHSYAQKVANAYDCSGNLKHTSSPYGENLGVGYSSAQSVVNAWYSEGKNYNYQTATKFDHFTQVIWKSTTQLGCAYKDCSARGWGMYVICNYKEVGNVKGQGQQNVLPLV